MDEWYSQPVDPPAVALRPRRGRGLLFALVGSLILVIALVIRFQYEENLPGYLESLSYAIPAAVGGGLLYSGIKRLRSGGKPPHVLDRQGIVSRDG